MNASDSMSPAQEKHPEAHSKKHLLAWAIVLIVCGLLLLPLLHHSKTASTAGPKPGSATEVNVATATTGSMDIYLDALGTVTPQNTINVYSQVSGRVVSVNYREGQMVSKGQTLVEIDPRPYQAELQTALGSLKRDSALLEQARADLKRYQEAVKTHAVSEQTVYDEQQTVKQYEGTVQNDQGTVQYDKVELSYCHIVAPISGHIGLRLIDAGNTVFSGSSSTIAVVTQIRPMTVVFSIPEDRIEQIRQRVAKGGPMAVDIYDRAQATKLATGKLLTLDNAVDTTTGTVKLRAIFDNADGNLFPNQFVNARLRVGSVDNAILIPTVAVQYNGPQAFVYRLQPNKTVAIQNVTIINTEKGQSAVQGLAAGNTVVTTNFDRVQEGAPVTIAGEQKQPGATPATH
jgi:multidrug efflux system membrane fusion protein